jgi:hypothetical protein
MRVATRASAAHPAQRCQRCGNQDRRGGHCLGFQLPCQRGSDGSGHGGGHQHGDLTCHNSLQRRGTRQRVTFAEHRIHDPRRVIRPQAIERAKMGAGEKRFGHKTSTPTRLPGTPTGRVRARA